ncbi:MAG: DsrE family protein [Actinomycetota bacterium]
MSKVLVQIGERSNSQRNSVALSTAAALVRSGHEVTLCLFADGAYLADPGTYATGPAVHGFPKIAELLDTLSAVPTLVSAPCAEVRRIEPSGAQRVVSFDEIAAAVVAADQVLTY